MIQLSTCTSQYFEIRMQMKHTPKFKNFCLAKTLNMIFSVSVRLSLSSLFNVQLSCFDSFWYNSSLMPCSRFRRTVANCIWWIFGQFLFTIWFGIFGTRRDIQNKQKMLNYRKNINRKKEKFDLTLSDTHKYTDRIHKKMWQFGSYDFFASFSLSLTHRSYFTFRCFVSSS